MGIDSIWIPPGCKGANPSGNGYDIYDLYDLGEFGQKGSRSTKWGTKEELLSFASRAQLFGIGLYWDAVLNHKAGADFTERFQAVKVDPQSAYVDPLPSGMATDCYRLQTETEKSRVPRRSKAGRDLTSQAVVPNIARSSTIGLILAASTGMISARRMPYSRSPEQIKAGLWT
jgi:hypothetical protein